LDGFERVACPDGKLDNPYRYDAALGIARLARPVAQGEIVRAAPEFGASMIRPGDVLELVSAAGSVRIERDVEALQAARPGQRLFVRAHDGQVISVRYEDVAP
jgi:flagella basal body P-ring formation protein FlgA